MNKDEAQQLCDEANSPNGAATLRKLNASVPEATDGPLRIKLEPASPVWIETWQAQVYCYVDLETTPWSITNIKNDHVFGDPNRMRWGTIMLECVIELLSLEEGVLWVNTPLNSEEFWERFFETHEEIRSIRSVKYPGHPLIGSCDGS